MAKVSAIDKNKKRKAKIEQYASKRAELKKTSEDVSLPAEERVKAMIKLSELPRNS